MEDIREITDILRALGSLRATLGRRRTVAAIALALEDEDRLTAVSRDIYQVVGKRFGCKGPAVERNIRTVSQRAWRMKREKLEEMARYSLDGPPSAAEFLEIVATHLQRKRVPGRQE